MKVLLRMSLCAVAVAILLAAVSGEAAQNKKKNSKGVKGAVVKVDADSVTVKTRKKTEEVTYKLNASTKVEKAGKKGAAAVPAQISDIRVGSQVTISGPRRGVAEKVVIGKKKKNAA